MSDSILRCKSKDFAKKIVFLCRDTKTKTKESVLTNQLLRSGTSIGANVYEAQYAQGKKDFISKLEIAQKECFETEYWLDLLFETGYIEESIYKPLQNQCGAIRRMLISSLNTAKEGCRWINSVFGFLCGRKKQLCRERRKSILLFAFYNLPPETWKNLRG